MSDFIKEEYRSILNGVILVVQRVAEVFSSAHTWYQKNAETINTYFAAFAGLSLWFSAVQKMADAQIVFTGNLSLEMAQEICTSNNASAVVERYYTEDDNRELGEVFSRCQQASQVSACSELFSQIISAYYAGHYHLACLGMLAVVDGILSDVSAMKESTSYKKRIQKLEQKIADKFELSDLEKKLLCIYVAMDNFEESIFKNSDFSQNEPETLNRHWMMHGRTHRAYTNLDFIKIILWLDAIIFLDDKLSDSVETS